MKITLLIESLGGGGAEGQLCLLAGELQRRGHDILVATYAQGDFYAPLLDRYGVRHMFLGGDGTIQWIPRIRSMLRRNDHDVVLAFMASSASYAELAALPFRRWGLVVSERGAKLGLSNGTVRLRKVLHLIADAVTTNSHTNRLMLEAAVPSLRTRVITIYNAVDLDRFRPGGPTSDHKGIRLMVAAKLDHNKNILRAIEAMDLVRKKHRGIPVSMDWFGGTSADLTLRCQCLDEIRQRGLGNFFRIHDATPDIVSRYQQADAVMLPSLHEGLPNSICEGMACGKPILMSTVCDAGNLVRDHENGFLFSPRDPYNIAEAVSRFLSLSQRERLRMGERNRELSERYFSIGKFVDMYESVLNAASLRKRPQCGHWPPEVPQTALDFLEQAKKQNLLLSFPVESR